MKAIVSIFLSAYLFVGSLFPGNSFANFSELPTLFQHYIFHTEIETPGITFFDFITLHYCNDGHEKSDLTHHQKLPLHHRTISTPVDEIVYTDSFDKLLAVEAGSSLTTIVYSNVFFPSAITKGIFHPPKA
jgi:hypothetical protein